MYPQFSDEQRRILLNLSQYYGAYIDAERSRKRVSSFPLHWKTVSGKDYLYEIIDSRGNAKSKGPRSEETEVLHRAWHEADERSANAKALLIETGRLYRAMRLAMISGDAAAILPPASDRAGGGAGTASPHRPTTHLVTASPVKPGVAVN